MQREDPQSFLDLRGTTCPMAFVKTKIHLDKVTPGKIVRIVYDHTPANEPLIRSIRSLGHHILSQAQANALYPQNASQSGTTRPPSVEPQLTILEIEVKA